MKIENNTANPILPNKAEGLRPLKDGGRAGESVPPTGAKDRAELSERGRLLSKARAAFESAPSIDQAKVDALQEKVNSGTYVVPLEELAHRLLDRLGFRSRG